MQVHHEYRVNAFGAGGRNGVVHAEGVLLVYPSAPHRSSWGSRGAGRRSTSSSPQWQAVLLALFPASRRSPAWNLPPSTWTRKACSTTRMVSGVLRKSNCDRSEEH